jgi:hypothetical protein
MYMLLLATISFVAGFGSDGCPILYLYIYTDIELTYKLLSTLPFTADLFDFTRYASSPLAEVLDIDLILKAMNCPRIWRGI